jgi:hypothetical protein
MAVAVGRDSEYAVAYGPTLQSAHMLAATKIHNSVNPLGHCSWE